MTTPTEIELTFRSELHAPRDQMWAWIASVEGISRELWPVLKMTVPASIKNITDVHITPGQPLFRSWVLLFGVLPIDRSDLTLLHLEAGRGFVEQSPMISMALWRHERTLEERDGRTILTDHLTFQPRLAKTLTRWFIRTVFTHRHNVLRRQFG
jgi:ligand-binding SRPBCC domain-containing protein